MYEIRYNYDQLNAAAIFVWKNNKKCPDWPQPCFSPEDVKKVIHGDLRRLAAENMANRNDPNRWISWSGTGGYIFFFTSEDPFSIEVDILVDPSTGNDKYQFMTEVID